MDEQYEYRGGLTFNVIEGKRGPILRFLRGDEVVTEIYLTRDGAESLVAALLGSTS